MLQAIFDREELVGKCGQGIPHAESAVRNVGQAILHAGL